MYFMQRRNKTPLIMLIVLFLGNNAFAQNDLHISTTWIPQKPYTLAQEQLVSLATNTNWEVNRSIQYADAFGRPLQKIAVQASPNGNDLVEFHKYNGAVGGREENIYMPFVATSNDGRFNADPVNNQFGFYQSLYSSENIFYSRSVFENSPLNRTKITYAPGSAWGGSSRGSSMQYLVNTAKDNVRIWDIDNNTSGSLPTNNNNYYAAGLLYKTISTDVQGLQMIEYKDLSGHVVLKKTQLSVVGDDGTGSDHSGWLCTYYVFDDFGHLRFIIPPKVVESIDGNWVLSNAMADELCIRYEYDMYDRVIITKNPGVAVQQAVYDKRGRLVFTQDGNLRTGGNSYPTLGNFLWNYTLYDILDRPVQTGLFLNYSSFGSLQNYVDNNTGNATLSTITTDGFSPSAYPADIAFSYRDPSKPLLYHASSSISFEPGFDSELASGNIFIAEIVPAPASTKSTNSVEVSDYPIPPTNGGSWTDIYPKILPLTQKFYDNYTQTTKAFDNSFNNKLDKGNNTNLYADPLPTRSTSLLKGMATVTKTRVLTDDLPNFNDKGWNPNEGLWLETTCFYDDKGRNIQVQGDNEQGGTDIITNLNSFTGKTLSSFQLHHNPKANTSIAIRTDWDYDAGGRTKALYKTTDGFINGKPITNSGQKRICKIDYNEIGQVVSQTLAPDYNGGSGLEKLDYTYNLRGWLTGINKDFVMAGSTGKAFGMELAYDNQSSINNSTTYANPIYNGNIAGVTWRTCGDPTPRKYDYAYDNANRFTQAAYTQNTAGNSWDNSTINYSVGGGTSGSLGNIAYDANGNLLSMKQYGFVAGGNPTTPIDNLTYNLKNSNTSNKLLNVIDASNNPQTNLGDFHYSNTAKTSSDVDYTYDDNGNVVVDKNRNARIHYNLLNRPKSIILAKGKIAYLYDAAGIKLKKTTTEANTNVVLNGINYTTSITTETNYIGEFVYQSKTYSNKDLADLNTQNDLLHWGNEKGIVTPFYNSSNTNVDLVYDYFIKDNLGNVRMRLTEKQDVNDYPVASLETATLKVEKLYYQIPDDAATLLNKNTVSDYPYDPYTKPNDYVHKLVGSGTKIGTNIVLKVMAGDEINIRATSWYNKEGKNPNTGSNPITELIDAFSKGAVKAAGGAIHGMGATQLVNSGTLSPGINSFLTYQSNQYNSDKPKAFINWILLDEQLNFVHSSSNIDPIGDDFDSKVKTHNINNIPMYKNGYLFIFESNETPNIPVYFDNFQVTHIKGNLLEEKHYYPFGLTMQGLSSHAEGKLSTAYGFQGKEMQNGEFNDGSGLEEYDFEARYYDQQLGRWHNMDPAGQFASGYIGMGNNWINGTDPDGRFVFIPILIGAAVGALSSASLYTIASGSSWNWSSFGQAVAFGAVGGAISGGFSSLGTSLGAFGQSVAYNMLSSTASSIGTNLAFGNNVSFGTVVGATVGAVLGGAVGNFSGVEGGAVKNIIAEMSFSAAKGAFTGGVGGAVGASFDGQDIGSGFINGARNGAIGGIATASLNIAAFGPAYVPERNYGNFGHFGPVYRSGTFLTRAIFGEGSGITLGRNLITHLAKPGGFIDQNGIDINEFNQYLQAHETSHYVDQLNMGFGKMYSRVLGEYMHYGQLATYTTPGTLEYGANMWSLGQLGYYYDNYLRKIIK